MRTHPFAPHPLTMRPFTDGAPGSMSKQQIPGGNDRKKSKGKGKGHCSLSAPHHKDKGVMLWSR